MQPKSYSTPNNSSGTINNFFKLITNRNISYAEHTAGIFDVLSHVTEAIMEYQKLPSGMSIQWVSIEIIKERSLDVVNVEGIITVVDDKGNKTNSRLFGIIPLTIVLQFDKQTIFTYFDEQVKLREFVKYEKSETDTVH